MKKYINARIICIFLLFSILLIGIILRKKWETDNTLVEALIDGGYEQSAEDVCYWIYEKHNLETDRNEPQSIYSWFDISSNIGIIEGCGEWYENGVELKNYVCVIRWDYYKKQFTAVSDYGYWR